MSGELPASRDAGQAPAPLMGVVADDITGANDIGGMFARSGLRVHVYPYPGPGATWPLDLAVPEGEEPEILILDTNSRLETAPQAYARVVAATRLLQAAGCRSFFNKTCSVFRGNIGAEFDAMLDVLRREFAVVVLGFPKNGRTTLGGIHYVHGRRLEESEFRHDPTHPMTQSDLRAILQGQTSRRVAHLDHSEIVRGPQALRAGVAARQAICSYLILDVVDQASLATIAAAVHDQPVLCGSSALAEELPAAWGWPGRPLPAPALPRQRGLGLLVAAGSLMPQTRVQSEYLLAQGAAGLELNVLRLFWPVEREAEVERLAAAAVTAMGLGHDVLLQSPNRAEAVAAAQAEGYRRGLRTGEVGRLVSAALAEAVGRALERTGQNRLVVAGGETSAAVSARLGVSGLLVGAEIQPGLPACLTLAAPQRKLVLKSGSFGSPDFLEQALVYLKTQ